MVDDVLECFYLLRIDETTLTAVCLEEESLVDKPLDGIVHSDAIHAQLIGNVYDSTCSHSECLDIDLCIGWIKAEFCEFLDDL